MFYKEVGVLPAILVFFIVISLYRFVTWLTAKSINFELIIEGRPLYLVRDGKFSIEDFDKEELTKDEFFAELRVVEHLGQVKNAIMETSGTISIYIFRIRMLSRDYPFIRIFTAKNPKTLTQRGAMPVLIAAIRLCWLPL